MAFKMKGFSGFKSSPAKQTKSIPGEDTGEIKKDKKGQDYTLSLYDMASGINEGDTLFVTPNIPRAIEPEYVMGGESYDAVETEGSKKRKKGPKSYTLKTQ